MRRWWSSTAATAREDQRPRGDRPARGAAVVPHHASRPPPGPRLHGGRGRGPQRRREPLPRASPRPLPRRAAPPARGARRRQRDLALRGLRAAWFVPADTAPVRGEPSARRQMLDRAALNVDPGYLEPSRALRRLTEQKAAVLRSDRPDAAVLDALDEQLAAVAARITAARSRLVAQVRERFVERYRDLAEAEAPGVEYRPALEGDATAWERHLEAARPRELAAHRVLATPGRDDLYFSLDGMPAKSHASQGRRGRSCWRGSWPRSTRRRRPRVSRRSSSWTTSAASSTPIAAPGSAASSPAWGAGLRDHHRPPRGARSRRPGAPVLGSGREGVLGLAAGSPTDARCPRFQPLPPPTTALPASPSSRASRRCASDPRCTSGTSRSAACTTSPGRSLTTPWTRPWPGTARASS